MTQVARLLIAVKNVVKIIKIQITIKIITMRVILTDITSFKATFFILETNSIYSTISIA